LTNYLKELASYRHWNMMEETHIINIIKERVCFTSLDFAKDLGTSNLRGNGNTMQQLYVLPDFTTSSTGYVRGSEGDPSKNNKEKGKAKEKEKEKVNVNEKEKEKAKESKKSSKRNGDNEGDDEDDDDSRASSKKRKATNNNVEEEQILPMNNERFTVPELLFCPSNVGINQAGIPEAITQAISSTHTDLHELLYGNILLLGGNCLFPNFKQRLEAELRLLVPADHTINIVTPSNFLTCTWEGCSLFAQMETFSRHTVTKEEYEENGFNLCKRKFYN